MKGIVFTEFVEMVEDSFSPETADRIIDGADLPSAGAYTSVGTYDHQEMLQLVARLSAETGLDPTILVRRFGRHLLGRFVDQYPAFFEGIDNSFDFLATIEHHVHVEVLKLYPDAELPTFHTARPTPDVLEMHYQSKRPFADLARGLIEGCVDHFGERVDISEAESIQGDRRSVRFTLRREAVSNR